MNIPTTAALVLGIVVGILVFIFGFLIIALGAPTSGPAIPLAVLLMFLVSQRFFSGLAILALYALWHWEKPLMPDQYAGKRFLDFLSGKDV